MALRRLDREQVRAVRILAQGLPAARAASLRKQCALSGFQRTVGGSDAYLGLSARVPKMTRGDLEALVDEGALRVVPAVRGCIYLVPHEDVPLCLRIAEALSRARDERDAERAGIRKGELEGVGHAVLQELTATGPMTTDALRRALPKSVLRSLGDRGKKVGVSSTLPPALRRLEFAGRLARTPVDGRLDHEKYLWRATDIDPFASAELPGDLPRLHALLLERFVACAGVTTLSSFCEWSGLTNRDAAAAAPHIELIEAEAEGLHAAALCTPALDRLLRKCEEAKNAIAFLPFADNVVHLTGGLAPWVETAHHDLEVPIWGNVKSGRSHTRLGDAKHAHWRSILADGRIRGFWEYNPDDRAVATHLFDPPSKAITKKIDAEAAVVSTFLRDQIGHGRSFSLDTDDELRRRVALFRDLP